MPPRFTVTARRAQLGLTLSAACSTLVQATMLGRTTIAHPVEGFAGFNPALAKGAYVVKLRVTDGILDVRVEPMPIVAPSSRESR